MKNKIISLDVYSDLLSISWASGDSSYVKLRLLRESCPCAFCSGEKDVFGNIYKGKASPLPEKAFTITNYSFVGLYGLKITWGDMHADGIYTLGLIKKISS